MAILISTPTQLQAINSNLTGQYELANDIDMTGVTFTSIGTNANRFSGIFDGKGFKIKNLTISSIENYIGLFGYIQYATIKNLGVEDANIISTKNIVGIIAGYSMSSRIENCYSTGIVQGNTIIGGIVGRALTYNSTADVIGTVIENCYSTATVTATTSDAGGLAGQVSDNKSYIKNGYATGQIDLSPNSNAIIGFTGTVPITNFSNLFYNNQVATSQIGTGLTTAQFADSTNFIGFDTAIWGFSSTPYLKVFGVPEIPSQKITQTLTSHSEQFESVLESSKRKIQVLVSESFGIDSGLSRGLKTGVESFVDDIVSDATYTFRTAKTKNISVESYSEHIDSSLNKSIRAKIIVESESSVIISNLDIFIPVDETEIIVAYLTAIENLTSIETIENLSNTTIIENQTEIQVI